MSGLLTSSATGDQLQFHPAAKWIVERKFRLPESAASAAPFSILLLDRQYFLRADACFVRHVRQINHQEAADKLSKVNIPFASQREHLTLHWIRIWRDGVAVEQVRGHRGSRSHPVGAPQPGRGSLHTRGSPPGGLPRRRLHGQFEIAGEPFLGDPAAPAARADFGLAPLSHRSPGHPAPQQPGNRLARLPAAATIGG